MLNRLGYWLRETFASLRRNLTLTVAAVLTAAVSLLLLGVALLARQGVGNQLVQWKGGVQFIVFMKADATEDQIQSVRTALAESPQVDDAQDGLPGQAGGVPGVPAHLPGPEDDRRVAHGQRHPAELQGRPHAPTTATSSRPSATSC